MASSTFSCDIPGPEGQDHILLPHEDWSGVTGHTRSSLRLEPKVLPKKAANENKKQPELDNASLGKGANVHLDGTARFDAQEQA
jgi:hypothetical protein